VSQPIVTRLDFQELAAVRLVEAKALLDASMWDGAYYLAGYAVEVGLKACIIKRVQATDAFLEKRFSEKCYTHDFGELVDLAALRATLNAAAALDAALGANWAIAIKWTEQKRYSRLAESEARILYDGIADTTNGVFQWIKTKW